MEELLRALGLPAPIQRVGGLVYRASGRPQGWGLVRKIVFFDGYETLGSVTLVVLALALFAAAGSRGRRGR